MAPRNLILHRQDVHNVGDIASSPAWYIPELRPFFHADITTVDFDAFDELGTVIVGGGGLLRPEGNGWYADRWRYVLSELTHARRPQLLVLWGVGHIDNRVGASLGRSEFCAEADLVGIRDRIEGVPFVPCASALHPFFDLVPEPTCEVAVFYCADRPLSYRGSPAMSNDTLDVAGAMAHCASGELLVTNSYHGWYWGTLAGRRVVLVNPRTTKFDALAWPGARVEAEPAELHLLDMSSRGVAHPDALAEVRACNEEFAKSVLSCKQGL